MLVSKLSTLRVSRLGFYAERSVDLGLTGEAIAIGFLFELLLFRFGAGREIFHPLDHFDNTGSALTASRAIGHLAPMHVPLEAALNCLQH